MEAMLDMKDSMAHALRAYTSQTGISSRTRAGQLHADDWDAARSERKGSIPGQLDIKFAGAA